MQIKRPKPAPAVSLIGRVTAEAMTVILRELDSHGAYRWEVARTGQSADGEYLVIRYWPKRGGTWEICFGIDGSLWMD